MIILYRLYDGGYYNICMYELRLVTTSYNTIQQNKKQNKNYRNWVCECVYFVISHVFGSDFDYDKSEYKREGGMAHVYSKLSCIRTTGRGGVAWCESVGCVFPFLLKYKSRIDIRWKTTSIIWMMARAYNYVGKHFVKTQYKIVHHFSNTHIKLYHIIRVYCFVCYICYTSIYYNVH